MMERKENPRLNAILGQEYPCLDHGFIRLIDYMGTDESIVQAARVSYGKGTKQVQQDRSLIRYLMRHQHTTPFEMVEFKFHCKLPIFVARQWIRHRTASVNEYSLRYSEAINQFYTPTPEAIRFQSKTNRQGGSAETVPSELQARVLDILTRQAQESFALYEEMEQAEIARELARIHLPVSLYTEWYWKINLHNLLHFLQLRLHPTAQHEIRVYAEAIAAIVKIALPITWEAFEDYMLDSVYLSRLERQVVQKVLATLPASPNWLASALTAGLSRREAEEFAEKMQSGTTLPPE